MTAFEAQAETARGRALYGSLLAVHALIRRDLDLVQELAAQTLEGIDAEELRRQLKALERGSMLWRLQVNCLHYCSFVHLHHHAEDADFFSELRDANPAIDPVIDRLQAEHRRVSQDLDAVETAANGLAHDGGRDARKAVVEALHALRENLLAHLHYEEVNLEAGPAGPPAAVSDRCSVVAPRNRPNQETTVNSQAAAPPIVLVHGLWLTPRSWEGWKERFETEGHQVLAPAWPRMQEEVEDVRRDPSALNGLGVTEIVDHYAGVIRALDRAPVIMGHSFGGLVTELLLDRGLGAAGVAISPAPVKGVLRLPPAELRSGFPVLRNPANRNRTVELTPRKFHYGFTNTMAEDEAKAAYDRYQVPGPGRVIFQAAFANLNPRAVTRVDFHKDDRPPLLIIGNDKDHTVPASVSKEAAQRLGKSKAVVDYKEFAGRPHFTAGAPGWQNVADYALDWANRHTGTSAERKAPAPA